MALTPSAACYALIRKYETKQNDSYWDSLGKCWTIGYGHTGAEVGPQMYWPDDTCEDILEVDATKACTQMQGAVTVALTQGQTDALTDFVFNEGIGHFKDSTLLKFLNRGDYVDARSQLLRWDYAGGAVNPDLEKRRGEEYEMFGG